MIFINSLLSSIDEIGECDIEELLSDYTDYYMKQYDNNRFIEKNNSPYNKIEYLSDEKSMKQNMLANPFEKFERKRFMYYSKDLGKIAFNSDLWQKLIENNDLGKLNTKMREDLIEYIKTFGNN